jgi:hypothetical protein
MRLFAGCAVLLVLSTAALCQTPSTASSQDKAGFSPANLDRTVGSLRRFLSVCLRQLDEEQSRPR